MSDSRSAGQEERAGTKERIMQAAERLFAEQGYAATSVGQIAQAAGANRALLYYYFQDKRDLYWAIIEGGLKQVLELLADVSRVPGGTWERLERFVRSYYELLMGRHNVARMVFREMTGSGEQLGLSMEKYLRESYARVRSIIEQGLNSGELQGVDPELAALSLLGMIHVFFTQRMTTGRGFPADVVVAHTLGLFRHGAQSHDAHEAIHSAKRKAKRQS